MESLNCCRYSLGVNPFSTIDIRSLLNQLAYFLTVLRSRSDIFDYIEMFYNPKRRHSSAMQLSPIEYEKRYFLSLESV
ncbi:IS3 family transposase [Lacticaseibacillus pantheris]|nr:IS3 family transposase [Lacticaseibacillus pantheris]WKF85829.1 IS3 family transposase [Lacticaseibacillus pantheris]